MILTRPLVIAATISTCFLVLAGCSPFGSATDSDTLTLLTIDGGDDNLALEDIVDAFEAENEGVTVEVTYVPEDTYPTKLSTALLADAPDIATPYGADTEFSFEPLDETVFAAHDLDPNDYNAALRSYCDIDGNLRCIGTTVGNMVLFYNKAMFDAAGIEYPSTSEAMTFDEFASTAAQLTITGGDDDYVWGGGGDIVQAYLDPAYYLDETGRTVDVLNDGYVGTLETLAGMVADGSSPSSGQTLSVGGSDDAFGLQTMFIDGQLAMFIGDNYSLDAIEETDLEFGLAPTPIVAGGEPWIPVWTNAYGIPQNAKHPELAAEFLAFVADEGQSIQANYGQMPLLSSVAEEWANTEGRTQLVEVSRLARTGIFNPNQWAWNAPLIDAFKLALQGEDVQTLLEEAQPKAQQANDTTWEIFDQAAAAAAE